MALALQRRQLTFISSRSTVSNHYVFRVQSVFADF